MQNKDIFIEFNEYNEELRLISSSFSCGNWYIDNFLKGSQSLENDICKTFVMIQVSEQQNNLVEKEIIGFYSLSADAVFTYPENSSKILLSGGAIRINMFAIDSKFQGKNISINGIQRKYASLMLLQCLNHITTIVQSHVGAMYIILDSTKQGEQLYRSVGEFHYLSEDDELHTPYAQGSEDCIPMYKFIKNEEY